MIYADGAKISTHAPLAGRDSPGSESLGAAHDFNPRAPCGARPLMQDRRIAVIRFQPTRPLRGATTARSWARWRPAHFNPRAPCGARHWLVRFFPRITRFQPTRPLRGATSLLGQVLQHGHGFQPTRPLRGATQAGRIFVGRRLDFNPRAPCGARQLCKPKNMDYQHFNPRAPCGARQQKCTNHYAHFCDNRQISDAFAQNAACQGILLLFDAGKSCGFWVRTAQVISAHLCFAL